ncbi:hypothetical protein O0I10_006650 [Lichtheimia ornata]|uniref:F-box domain-containing protein n=1 Tax=Lichtheimia ornata TaxID=688661 RepID=A0AAD7V302_9FUNG|nr:uncharacterized protein O0I10_006650 [Lichtheimia ornata]KAJ8657586.1 hypothetical protein O0I10_006650 [Lichtheimia ornata]
MTYSIWNDLCKQPVITASTEKYTKLVTNATTQLRQPIDSIMTTLNERAMGLSKCANFDAALRDANAMQQLAHSSALGYLRASSIYNEQGKRRHAVDICHKGLNVVDINDPHYAMLQRAKDDAEHYESKRFDFIMQLPVEIVITTLIPMLVDDTPLASLKPCPYLHVSNLWRDFILQHSDGLCFETGYHEEEEDMEKRSQLMRFCRHIKSLHVRRYSKGLWLYHLLSNNDFCSLRELCVDDFYSVYIDDLVPLLLSISSTLTKLTIHEGWHDMLFLVDILTACPNLVSLTMSQYDGEDLGHLPSPTWPNLQTFSIEYSNHELTREQIVRLCQCFPSLKKLHLYPCPDLESALLISRYYSLLTRMELEVYMGHVGVTYMNENNGSHHLAMTKLSVIIQDWDDEDDVVDMAPIFRQHHATLEVIEWNMEIERDYEGLHHLTFPCLKKLSLCTSGSWILRNAPIVEELKMATIAINEDPAMLNTIPPRLKRLEFKFDNGRQLENKEAIVQYLRRVSQQSSLHEFGIRVDFSNTLGSIPDAICGLNTLQRLMIGANEDWSPYQMERFFTSLVNGCPSLSCLEIDCMNAPSTYSLDTLKRLERLKQFAFSIKDTDGYDSFWHSLRTFSQLKCIQMYPANAVNKAVIRDLKAHRRDMKVIVDGIFKRF